MTKQTSKPRKWWIRASLFALSLAFWMLGDVKRSYRIEDSPDGRFSTFLVARCGWRVFDFRSAYNLFVADNSTGRNVLAATQREYCSFEKIELSDLKWDTDSRRFTCFWAIQNNGIHQQFFQVQEKPLTVKAGAPCCGT